MDSFGAQKDAAERNGARFDARRAELRALYQRGDWQSVIDKGLRLQIDLGAAPPAKC